MKVVMTRDFLRAQNPMLVFGRKIACISNWVVIKQIIINNNKSIENCENHYDKGLSNLLLRQVFSMWERINWKGSYNIESCHCQ
jgi:hypothetical protein